MKDLIPHRFATLGHPQRLALFRLLMRRYPDQVPATELAQALDVKPNTLSTYVNALMEAGLIGQTRVGTSLRYAVDLDAARDTLDYLLNDCCRGRPDVCRPDARLPVGRRLNVLFLCTGNAARSILAEAILRDLAGDRFAAHSAGTQPRQAPDPRALALLKEKGHDTASLHSKHVADYRGPGAPVFDLVLTVCDRAANEDCPAWEGRPLSGHWGLPDPAGGAGAPADRRLAFEQTYGALQTRIRALAALPMSSLDRMSLQQAVDDIGQITNEGTIQ